jgi:acetolactate synthase I/II/III large subunit
MTIAEYIADQLYKQGVRYVFGIPGGPSIPYMEAFREAGIEFILTSNESAAAIMADVTARLTSIPGICHATFGPGATNISTGIGGALLDRSPVIVFTSEFPDKMINRTTQMNINNQKLFEPITKYSFRINPENIHDVLESALSICQSPYPGPVHIGLPSDIAETEIDFPSVFPTKPEIITDITEKDKVKGFLGMSSHPVIAIGLTAARYDLQKEILELVERVNCPVVITPMAKGIIPEDHRCYAGVLFHALSDYLEDLFDSADLVIGIGYDPVEFNYESWMPDVPLIHFDVQRADMPDNLNVTQFISHPSEWFRILDNLKTSTSGLEIISNIRTEMKSVFDGLGKHFGPVAAMRILQDNMTDNMILTTDVGSHLHLAGQYWKTNGKSDFIITNGWSGMGFGLPAALAAQLVHRDKTVVCITGDGGFLMMAGEIITARRYNLPVIVVVFSDGELNLIKVKQTWKNLPQYGTSLYQGDMFVADAFFGIKVLRAFDVESMKKAVIDALSTDEPVIINAAIDPEDYKWLIVKR